MTRMTSAALSQPLRTLSACLLTAMLSTAGFSAMAQTTTPSAPNTNAPTEAAPKADSKAEHGHHDSHGSMRGRHDPEKMNGWRTRQQADLKAKLQLTHAQESAWTAFTASLQPMAGQRTDHHTQMNELSKLPTPERLDRMRTLHNQHMAEMTTTMDKRAQATKAFYAALTPDQQKVFDAETTRMMRGGGRGHGGGHGGHHHGGMQHGRG